MPTRSSARAALLAAAMSFVPATPVDILRFLRVPAIVMTIRQAKFCRESGHRRRRAKRADGWQVTG